MPQDIEVEVVLAAEQLAPARRRHVLRNADRTGSQWYETGREITILIGEGALRTRLATAATMHAQREHIARLAETLTTATIAIVPFAAQAARRQPSPPTPRPFPRTGVLPPLRSARANCRA